jgi:signal transduction histidine kinase
LTRNWRTIALLTAMAAAVACVGTLAWWDGRRESAAALEDFGQEQATLAAAVASEAQARLGSEQPFIGLSHLNRPFESVLLLARPGEAQFRTLDGRAIASVPLQEGLASGASTVRLAGSDAAALGLPARTAMAGIARTGGWAIAVVKTAICERDLERHAGTRLVLSLLVALGLVGIFGGLALREQRRELELARNLALAQAAREQDARLQDLARAATMLTMASGVAHEISTPLGVIVGRAEQLLPRVAGDERARRSVEAILDQAEAIHQVVRNFLDLARGGAPSLELVPPERVVAAAMHLVEHRFAQAGVRLSSNLPAGLPPLRCEPRLLQHAVVNLLLNACDACPPGGNVEVSAAVSEGSISFSVLDDGSGITLQDAARATEPFFTTKPASKGTGLGLAIANEIAKSHHGLLSIGPAMTGGTRACVQIPLAEPSHA